MLFFTVVRLVERQVTEEGYRRVGGIVESPLSLVWRFYSTNKEFVETYNLLGRQLDSIQRHVGDRSNPIKRQGVSTPIGKVYLHEK